MNKQRFRRLAAPLLVTLALSACSGDRYLREADTLVEGDKLEEALQKYKAALETDPTNAHYRTIYLNARDRMVRQQLDRVETALRTNNPAEAAAALDRLRTIDPSNARAAAFRQQLARRDYHAEQVSQADRELAAGQTDMAFARVRVVLAENPTHDAALALRDAIEAQRSAPRASAEQRLAEAYKRPLSIEFRDAQLRQVFDVLSRTSGLNFILDKDVKGDQRTTIYLRNSTVANALALTLMTNQLEQRIVDANTVLIYPNSASKLKDYQPLTVRSFQVSNGDPKNIGNVLRTILKTKDVIVDEKQNVITMRDSPEAIRMAEKLVSIYDQPDAEVMLEIEVLEVARSRLRDLGIQFPSQLSLSPLVASGGTLTLHDLLHLNSETIQATVNPLQVNANATVSDVNVLANPRIRSKNHEKAKIQVGQRVPNITSTSTSTGFVAESVQYVDVGLKVEVEPSVSPDNDISIKISLEVSSILEQIQTKSGSIAYSIGTRNATSVLRLRDGENQVLAGLINDEDRRSGNRIPGVGEMPGLGRLFGTSHDEVKKSEIILSITPHIVRAAPRMNLSDAEFDSGTETSLRAHLMEGVSPVTTAPAPTPTSSTSSSAKDAARPATTTSGQTSLGDTNALLNTGSSMTSDVAAGTSTSTSSTTPSSTVGPGGTTTTEPLKWTSSSQAKVGGTWPIQLYLQTDESVTSVPFAVTFDPAVLELVSIDQGDFMSKSGAAGAFSDRIDNTAGNVRAVVNATNTSGSTGSGVLATLTFKPKQSAGTTQIQISDSVVAIGPGGKAVTLGLPTALVTSVQ
jgi:general secretion pathway protein D